MPRLFALTRTARILLTAAVGAVCLAQQALPDRNAKVIEQFGVLWAHSDNGLRRLAPGDTLKPQEMVETGPDGYGRFQVADGSTFEVFANSKVLFREHVGNLQDILNVVIGHIKVYIQHLNGLPNYNSVTSPTAVISVRGTVFEVVVEDDDGTTFVSLDEGIVGVKNTTAPGDPVELHPGDSIRVIRNQPLHAMGIDKGGVFRALLRAANDAVYQVMRQSGSIARLPGGGVAAAPTGNGDTGKGGSGAPPSAPGAPHPFMAPAASGAIRVAPPPLSLRFPAGANGTVGTAYSVTLVATGGVGPYTYSVSLGALPAGLTLNASTGAITGTPTASGNGPAANVTFKVTDAETPPVSAAANGAIYIAGAPATPHQ